MLLWGNTITMIFETTPEMLGEHQWRPPETFHREIMVTVREKWGKEKGKKLENVE